MHAIEMFADFWSGNSQQEPIVQHPTWEDIYAAIQQLDGKISP